MRKRLPVFAGVKIGVGSLLLAMTAVDARGDKTDDEQAIFVQSHPEFHGFLTPRPPYPLQARMSNAQGEVQVQVSFAAKGKVVGVVILKSSGSDVLDSNSSNYIKRYWRNLTGKPASHTQKLEYHLR